MAKARISPAVGDAAQAPINVAGKAEGAAGPPVSASNDNLVLWNRVQRTDPKYTKQFTRGGGFKGTAINATYMAKRATEEFGPIGIGWGVRIVDEQIVEGPVMLTGDGKELGREQLHKLLVEVWYKRDGVEGSVRQFGLTMLVGKNKYGPFMDEEAPKKSLTDGMTKCLSLIGFASDVHLGLFDDNKYLNDTKAEIAAEEAARPKPVPARSLEHPAPNEAAEEPQPLVEQAAAPKSNAKARPKAVAEHPLIVDLRRQLAGAADNEAIDAVRDGNRPAILDVHKNNPGVYEQIGGMFKEARGRVAALNQQGATSPSSCWPSALSSR